MTVTLWSLDLTMSVHLGAKSYTERRPSVIPLTCFRRFFVVVRTHGEPAQDSHSVQGGSNLKKGCRTSSRAMEPWEGVRACQRTEAARHVHGSRHAAGIFVADVNAISPAWTDRQLDPKHGHGKSRNRSSGVIDSWPKPCG